MQTIQSIDVICGRLNAIPCNSTFMTAAFLGGTLRMWFIIRGEPVDFTDDWIIEVQDLRTEKRLPDGFEFLTTVQRQQWDDETLALFIKR